ncbi:MAG TPA: hypothetical protein ENN60_03300 [archaeon]|nr:hypothetical protein [archaeon]
MSIELIIMGFFALLGVLLLKLLTGGGRDAPEPPPGMPFPPPEGGPSPYSPDFVPMPMFGYYQVPPPPPTGPRIIKKKVLIMPERIIRKATHRKRRLRV